MNALVPPIKETKLLQRRIAQMSTLPFDLKTYIHNPVAIVLSMDDMSEVFQKTIDSWLFEYISEKNRVSQLRS